MTNEYITFNMPSYSYIPYDSFESLIIPKTRKVYKDMILGKNNNNTNIFSNVSGYITSTKESNTINGKVKTLVIENNLIDKRISLNPYKKLNKLSKNEINELLIKYNLYKPLNSKSIIVIKSSINDIIYNYDNYEEILEMIDTLITLYKCNNSYIVVDKKDLISIESYNKYINAFENICIINDIKKISSKNIVSYSIRDIISIIKALHYDYFNDIVFININNKLIETKIFISLEELLNSLKISYKNKKIYVNNNIINIDNFIITSDIYKIEVK